MIKRILFFLLVLLLVVPSDAMANDANYFTILDEDNFLSINIIPLSNSLEIGEEYSFIVEFTNNTSEIIQLNEILQIFKGVPDNYGNVYRFASTLDSYNIDPGKVITATITAEVPYYIEWYKKDKDIYTDIDLQVSYSVCAYTAPSKYEGHTLLHKNKLNSSFPTKIKNIYDGADLANITTRNYNEVLTFVEKPLIMHDMKFTIYKTEYESEVKITNTSDKKISNIYIRSIGNNLEKSPAMSSGRTFTKILTTEYTNSDDNIDDMLTVEYKATFTYDDKYYATSIKNECHTRIIYRPKLDFKLISEEDESDKKYFIEVTNNTNQTYTDMYVFAHENRLFTISDVLEHTPINFKIDQSVKLNVLKNNRGNTFSVYYGLEQDGFIYIWEAIFDDELAFILNNSFNLLELKPLATPKPIKFPTSTPPPSPTIAPTEAPTPTLSPTDEPMIEVMDVKKSSSIPFWVWYVLVVAVIVSAMLMISFRKKINEDKYD